MSIHASVRFLRPRRSLVVLLFCSFLWSGLLNAQGPIVASGTFCTRQPGWQSVPVGSSGIWNAANYASGTFTVSGIGSQIGGTADSFGFAYERLSGNGSIVARVVNIQGGTLAGVMIRETLDAGSTNATTANWGARGTTYFNVRASTGGTTTWTGSASASFPAWVKLVRTASTFNSYSSEDGVNWTQVGTSQTINMAQNVFIGLAVTGGSASSPATATFDHVSSTSSGAALPCISTISATSGNVGDQVVIVGSGFGNTQGINQVLLNGTPVTINFWNNTTISATIPSGAITGSLLVHEPGPSSSSNDSNSVMFTVGSQPVVWGWMDYDLGTETYSLTQSPGGGGGGGSGQLKIVPGSTTYANESFTLNGSGVQIYGNSDTAHYLYQQLSGDGSIVARLVSVQGASGWWAAAGLVIRETLSSGAATVSLVDQPSPRYFAFDVRPTTNGSTNQVAWASVAPAYWMKLSRSGNSFSAFTSPDGMNWTQLGSTQTVSMAQNVYVGLCVTSASTSSLAAATFDNVSVSANLGSGPLINTISATTGAAGTQILISGSGFGNAQGNGQVTLNKVPVTVNFWSSTFISVTIPSGASTGDLVVTVAPSMNDSNPVWFTVTSQPLPSGWLDRDVGTVTVVGTSSYSNGTFTINGSGYQIYSAADSFHFAYQQLAGDGSITARVVSMQGASGWWAAAGVMIRETLDTASDNAALLDNPQPHNFGFDVRTASGGSTGQIGWVSLTPPYWVRVTRSGNAFRAYSSADASTWTQLGSTQTINMAQNVYAGLAVESGSTSSLATATFDNVSVSSSLLNPNIGSVQPTSGSEGDTVTISGINFGSTQGNSTVSFGGVQATTVGPWSDTQITAAVSTGTATGPVSITVNGLQSNQNVIFTINANISGINPSSGSVLSQFQITGSGFGATQGLSTVTFNGLPSPVLTWSSTEITALVPAGATTGNVVLTIGGISTNGPSFTVTAAPTPTIPSITGISPASGGAGTQVTINGSGFGAVQASGSVLLGTALGTVVSWSDTQVVAVVNSGSTTGVVQIQQAGYSSNAVSFTVAATTLTSVSPNNGIAGTQVTITGSGFGAAQGSGIAWLGTAPAVVTSWSDGQIIATVSAGAASGTAQVLQNGAWSNSVPFTINTPHITAISPTSGSSGTVVTVTGNGFGSTQGNGVVWIGNMAGVVSGWSNSQVVASVASNAVSGIVQVQQDGTWSNAVTFTVPVTVGQGTQVTLVPNVVSMVVGDTRGIQALDSNNQAVSGLTWTSSDTSIATLSSDDPPIITAVAPGNVTITAGGASTYVTVYAGPTLPTGTVIWSNPGDGSGVSSIVPAVPSPTGLADVFAVHTDGTVQAVTSDGITAWTATISGSPNLIPDFQGGLELVTQTSIQRLDGMTGNAYPAYTFSSYNSTSPSVVVSTDGTIFTVDGDSVAAINPTTGQPNFSVPMDHSTTTNNGVQNSDTPPTVGNLIVAGDGYAYVPYVYSHASGNSSSQYVYSSTSTQFLNVLRVGSGGDYSKIQVKQWSGAASSSQTITDSVPYGYAWCNSVCQQYTSFAGSCTESQQFMYQCATDCGPVVNPQCASQPGVVYFICSYTQCTAGVIVQSAMSVGMPQIANLITNADQGVLLSFQVQEGIQSTWTQTTCIPSAGCDPHTDDTSSGTQNNGTPNSYLATISSGGSVSLAQLNLPGQTAPIQPVLQRADGPYIGTVQVSGGINIMMAFASSGQQLWSQPNYAPRIATSDGGVIATSPSGQAVTFDQNGNADGQMGNLLTYSWKGAYSAADSLSVPLPSVAPVPGAVAGGGPTGKGTTVAVHSIGLFWCGAAFSGSCQGLTDANNLPEVDLGFTYFPQNCAGNSPPPNCPSQPQDFSGNGGWVNLMMAQAAKAVTSAFGGVPIVPPQRPSSALNVSVFGTIKGTPDHIVNVVGDTNPPSSGVTTQNCHLVFFYCQWNSVLYYTAVMKGAQVAVPSLSSPVYPPSGPSQTSAFEALLSAIGKGIGNDSAHELGHQFQLPDMDCDKTGMPDCPAPGNGNPSTPWLLYEYYQDEEPTYLDSGSPLQWDTNDQPLLKQLGLGK